MEIGFIILRHMNNEENSNYFMISYNQIRKFYPENNILIIDDNSNKQFINFHLDNSLYNTQVIYSEFPGRGELLPYYYFLKIKPFHIAVILHDSVFLNASFDFHESSYKFIWEFQAGSPPREVDEIRIIKELNNNEELLKLHSDKTKWKGCFGGMCIINYAFLLQIHNKYNIDKLLHVITSRWNRMSFERVIACMFQSHEKKKCLLGEIHKYCPWGTKFNKNILINNKLPIIKVWSGR